MSWPCSRSCMMGATAVGPRFVQALLRLTPDLLATSLPSERLLGPALVTRFEIEGMLLDVFDDIFLLYLALKAAERALDGLALLNLDFSHALKHPLTRYR